MAELTPEERQKIYEEEKVRMEAKEKLEKEKNEKNIKQALIGCGTIILLGVLWVFSNFLTAFISVMILSGVIAFVNEKKKLKKLIPIQEIQPTTKKDKLEKIKPIIAIIFIILVIGIPVFMVYTPCRGKIVFLSC